MQIYLTNIKAKYISQVAMVQALYTGPKVHFSVEWVMT
jgi:hypothetical protein